ncbi:Peptide chain release factor 1 PrfA [Helicobacter ailurogastricus]|uniref:Peptide chain release factor 1 n=1 Tax=Helicobacter heilmannii TaxID=35817 RepID=A0A0K2Y4G4_HELHE|nr:MULTISPECIES: peptide chain release factor 1 [Helicobacter]CCM11874.1 Peptide chain release factor 1 [Helicobacter heilmannii ASB1.4]CRI34016.1 Peptide chain release factor 1 [Helicobacter heilmannii]BDQ27419.1 peptide chain release factor 1 [Helicobacter heilmannii]BDQ28828.1 peptide chain release factor 1 [Helicobacter ailurogastricus]GMB89701.1 Peptide chain release factor 1 PrfA [Helicobacter ailurogastricus]
MLSSKLQAIVDRYDALAHSLTQPEVLADIKQLTALSKEQAGLEELAQAAKAYLQILEGIQENRALLEDKELGELAKEELKALEEEKNALEERIKVLLIPKDPNDNKNIYLELRAGTGGDEAGIFVGDLFKAYCRYADLKRWKVEIVSSSENSVGGYKEMIALIKGQGVYSRLKFEAGTHRVQRVPETESQGRIHTSAVTVAIMPEVDDVEVNINPSDLRIEVFRAGGHGGQCVNTTDSAVRITHVPTGISVSMQDEKSQHKNRDKALKILKARLYEKQIEEQQEANSASRKMQVGSGDRSERIRTYNYPQNRLSDHRINLTLYSLEELMLSGNLDPVIEPLIAHAQAQGLEQQGE